MAQGVGTRHPKLGGAKGGAPGFIDVKSFKAEDGERLTVVWWRDEESLQQWREQVRHRFAQETGRKKWYEYYKMEVATVNRQSDFERKQVAHGD